MLQGEFLKALSVGLITAVLTKGHGCDMGNYRGITVTPALAELFAMLLKNKITEFLESTSEHKHRLASGQIWTTAR